MKRSKIKTLALVGVLVFFAAGLSGCLGRIDDHAGDLLDADGELIGTWEVSHATDSWTRLYEQRPPGYPEEALYTFYEEDNLVEIVYNNRTYQTDYEYYEEEKELRIYDDPLLRPLAVYSSFEISFSYTGERMSWEHPDFPAYLVLESVD